MKPIVKIPGATVYLVHQCSLQDCGQYFRSEADLAHHEAETRHCSKCGMGYLGLQDGASATYCPGCMLDMTPADRIGQKV